MKLSYTQYKTILLAIISIALLIFVFSMIHYLTKNGYIRSSFDSENFEPMKQIRERYDGSTTHTVDLPINTTYSCQNFCGPTARCSKTGQQCFADIDCPGCQPYSPPLPLSNSECVMGNDSGGRLIYNQNPQYSVLTTDIGTRARIISENLFGKPVQANFGINTWQKKSEEEQKLFDKRYKPPQLKLMPNYNKRYSLTGDFMEDGPPPANAYL
jgi:hypothetical protein